MAGTFGRKSMCQWQKAWNCWQELIFMSSQTHSVNEIVLLVESQCIVDKWNLNLKDTSTVDLPCLEYDFRWLKINNQPNFTNHTEFIQLLYS